MMNFHNSRAITRGGCDRLSTARRYQLTLRRFPQFEYLARAVE